MSPRSPRSQSSGSADFSSVNRVPQELASRPLHSGSDANAQNPASAVFFSEALDGALALVRADGGEIAIYDETRQAMVLRARRTSPRHDMAFGSASRPSQPIPPLPSSSFSGRSLGTDLSGIKDETSPLDEIEVQSTQLLPATLKTRIYHQGERLIGYTWQRGEPITMRGEECRKLPGTGAPPDADAAWHLAVPILRPGELTTMRPTNEVIGVVSVYNRDPLWSFSPHDVELLALHADRIARAMQITDLRRQNQSQADLLDVLGSDIDDTDQQTLFARLRDVVRHAVDAPSFAVLLYHARQDDITFELAERDGQPVPLGRFPASTLPPWWLPVYSGHTVCISAPEDRALRPEYCMLGWGGDAPVQSILAAPLMIGTTLLGAIVAGSPRADVYDTEQAQLFASIARSGAIVIQKSRLADDIRTSLAKAREKERQLSILNNAVLTLNASLNLDETLRSIATQAVHLTVATVCAVLLVDEDTPDNAIVRAIHSRNEGDVLPSDPVRIPLSWRGLHALLSSGQFMLMDRLEAEWNDDTAAGRWLAQQQMKSCLVLPLTQQETALGMLVVHSPGQHYHFPSEEIVLLQGLASQAVAAISNARLYQRLERAYEQQKELDRLKDEFILTVSHEFRTPVTAIEGYVTLISRHGHKLDQAKLEQFAGEIHQATNQLMGMINTLHDANSMSNQPLLLTPHPVNVRAAAEKAIATQSPEAKARIQMEIPSDLWVAADDERLPHVFSNLLSNAIKYSPKGQPCKLTARIETREVLAAQGRPHAQAEKAPEHWVVVGVRDWGEGIASEDQARLFQKFVRLSRSLTTAVRGTGLGLWICRQYLEAMGGDIWVESEFGSGSHFQFCLPYESAP